MSPTSRKYAAVLNNFLATKYNTPEAFVPWNKLDVKLDKDALLPFKFKWLPRDGAQGEGASD